MPSTAGRLVGLGLVVALAVVSFLTRRDGLPQDGLWFDDAWVATGAIHGRLSELAMVGSGIPGSRRSSWASMP